MKRIAVIGGGIAGVSAAWVAHHAGHHVTLYQAGSGASYLTSGAVDEFPWQHAPETNSVATVDASFLESLSLWKLQKNLSILATAAGVLRSAAGADRSLLDLSPFSDTAVGVAHVAREGWDAPFLAASFSAEPWALAQRVRFMPVALNLWKHDDESKIAASDLAARLEQPSRRHHLIETLTHAVQTTGCQAILLGPWLGCETPLAPLLSDHVGAAVGEVLSAPGGPAGRRLRAALRRITEALPPPFSVVYDRATLSADSPWQITTSSRGSELVDGVVLAVGGLIAGGLAYHPPYPQETVHLPAHFHAPSWSSAVVELPDNKNPDLSGDLSWVGRVHTPLEDVGLRHQSNQVTDAANTPMKGVAVAGDAASHGHRTLLGALQSGMHAGRLISRL